MVINLSKSTIYLLIAATVGVYASVMVAFFGQAGQIDGSVVSTNTEGAQQVRAVKKAKQIFAEFKSEGTDFSNGPCISENLIVDWAADVAHNPRQAVDDLPENQCQSFRDGETHHFVELDTNGNLIRVY